jgi:quercetin dioxygenase-like cupin family protein
MDTISKAPRGVPFSLVDHIAYAEGAVVSKTLVQQEAGTVTLFAFDAGQGLSEHTAPFDAVVQVVDGNADIRIGDQSHTVSAGQMLIMPAHVPHALHAQQRFKMLLTMIRKPAGIGCAPSAGPPG